jgi:hypothetical protein
MRSTITARRSPPWGSAKRTEARESFWVPLLEDHEAAGVLRPGLNHRAIVRWITYQEFWLLTHPTLLCDNDAQLTEYIRDSESPPSSGNRPAQRALAAKPEKPRPDSGQA